MRGMISRNVALVAMCMMSMVLQGCAIPGFGVASTKASKGLKEMHDEYVAPAMNELEGTRALLDRLATTNDLPAWRKEFESTVAKMQSAGERASNHWQMLKDNGQAHIDHWDKEIAEMKTSEVKESVEARRNRVVAAFEKIKGEALQVREAYQPYLASLLDIQKALKVDLTPGGVTALKPGVDRAKLQGAEVAKQVDELGIELDRLAGRLQAKAPEATNPVPPRN